MRLLLAVATTMITIHLLESTRLLLLLLETSRFAKLPVEAAEPDDKSVRNVEHLSRFDAISKWTRSTALHALVGSCPTRTPCIKAPMADLQLLLLLQHFQMDLLTKNFLPRKTDPKRWAAVYQRQQQNLKY